MRYDVNGTIVYLVNFLNVSDQCSFIHSRNKVLNILQSSVVPELHTRASA